MRIRKTDGVLEGKAEGVCCGLPYDTELVSSAGVSIHFWCGEFFDEALLETALSAARAARDVVRATASLGAPTGFWAHNDILGRGNV